MFTYILIIVTGIATMSGNIRDGKITTIEGFNTLQSCQKAKFKTKEQDGILTAFCIERR